jgi:hypothetical protein
VIKQQETFTDVSGGRLSALYRASIRSEMSSKERKGDFRAKKFVTSFRPSFMLSLYKDGSLRSESSMVGRASFPTSHIVGDVRKLLSEFRAVFEPPQNHDHH